jgi:hypothetical protein
MDAIPFEATEFLLTHKISSHTVVLRSTKPPSQMCTRNLPAGKSGRRLRLTIYRECRCFDVSCICGIPGPITGTTSPFVIYNIIIQPTNELSGLLSTSEIYDWATATGQRILVPTFANRGVLRCQHSRSPTATNLSFLDRSRYSFFQIATHLSSGGSGPRSRTTARTEPLLFLSNSNTFILTRLWTPLQNHCYSENLVASRIEPGTSATVARNSDHQTTDAVQCYNIGSRL